MSYTNKPTSRSDGKFQQKHRRQYLDKTPIRVGMLLNHVVVYLFGIQDHLQVYDEILIE